MFFDFFKKKPTISYGITVCNEATELKNLLEALVPLVGRKDEIIVLQDITIKDPTVTKLLETYRGKIMLIEDRMNNDFAAFKNLLLKTASRDYLFQIDADEIPEKELIKNLKSILKIIKGCDCFFIPRINIVNGYTYEHVKKWNWNINDKNYINFPDYQARIFRLKSGVRWAKKVHERPVGYETCYMLPAEEDFCLIHIKNIERQEKQNEFYEKMLDKTQKESLT